MIRALVLAAALTPLASVANAGDEWSQVYRIPGQGTSFLNAQSVGIHNDTIASVSSFLYFDFDKDESRSGITVSIYRRTPGGWLRYQALNYFDRPTNESVTGRIAMSADRIIACAPAARSIIYLVRNAEGVWIDDPDATFTGAGSGTREAAFDDDHILIGHSHRGLDQGEVTQYTSDWRFVRQISSPSPAQYARFGYSLALEDGTLAVSEPGSRPTLSEPNLPSTQGRVHIFTRNGNSYEHTQTLEPPMPELGALFGLSVSMHDGVLAVGEPYRVNPDSPDGAVYVYRRTADGRWSFSDLILAPDSIPFDEANFGRNVNLRSGRLAIASPNTRTGLYVYEHTDNEWTLSSILTTPLEPSTAYSLAGNDDNLVFGSASSTATALYVAPREPECFRDLRGDANNDGVTNFEDLNLVLGDFGLEGDDLPADLSDDGIVDFIDLNFILFTFGSPCLPSN